MKLPALFLCLMTSIAMADEKQDFIKSIEIPDNLGPKGRQSLAMFFGHPLVVEKGKWQGILHFESTGRVAWTKPNGKTLHGHFGDSVHQQEICLDFSFDFNDCFEVQQQGDTLHFYKEGKGRFTGHAEQGEADATLPGREQDVCDAIDAILKAGRTDKRDSLVDNAKPPIETSSMLGPTYWTTVKIADEFCSYDANGPKPSIDCEFYYRDDSPDAESLYEALVGQVRACAKDEITEAAIDSDIWLRYVDYDYVKKGFRKIAKQDFKPGPSDSLRSSKFEFSGKMAVNISLGSRLICKDVVDCKAIYGVWSSFQRQ